MDTRSGLGAPMMPPGAGTTVDPQIDGVDNLQGQTVANFAVVPVAPCQDSLCGSSSGLPTMGVFTNQTTDVIVDLVGFIDDGTLANGLLFSATTPTRIADSPSGQGIARTLGEGDRLSEDAELVADQAEH